MFERCWQRRSRDLQNQSTLSGGNAVAERVPVGPPGGIPTGAQHGLGPNKPHMLRVLHYRCNASPDGELIVGCARAVIVLFAGSRYTVS